MFHQQFSLVKPMSMLNLPEARTARFSEQSKAPPPSHAFDGATQTANILQTAGIRDGDHVVVIGRKTLDHLIGLTRRNCRSVTAIHPTRSFPSFDKVDVIWVTVGVKADLSLLPLIQNVQGLRTIVIELANIGAGSQLSLLLEKLRFMGFVQVVSHGTADRKTVMMVSRPDWLRRIV
jgi:hypothetical protein